MPLNPAHCSFNDSNLCFLENYYFFFPPFRPLTIIEVKLKSLIGLSAYKSKILCVQSARSLQKKKKKDGIHWNIEFSIPPCAIPSLCLASNARHTSHQFCVPEASVVFPWWTSKRRLALPRAPSLKLRQQAVVHMEEFGDIYFFSPTLIPSEFEKEKEKKVHAEDEANF